MDIFNRMEKKVVAAAKKINFAINYLPGLDEDLDMYCAYNEELNIFCYGASSEEAINSARLEASARLLADSELTNWLLQQK